jgi:phage-related protein
MSALIGGVVGAVEATGKLVVGVFNISYHCGALIVGTILAAGRLTAALFSSVVDLLSIMYQDFCVFSLDLFSRVADVASLITCFVSGVLSTIKNSVLGVKDAVQLGIQTINDGFAFGFDAITQVQFEIFLF